MTVTRREVLAGGGGVAAMLLGGNVEPLLGDEKMPPDKYPICGWRPISINVNHVSRLRPCGHDGEAEAHGIKVTDKFGIDKEKEPPFGTYIWFNSDVPVHVREDYEDVLPLLNGDDTFVEVDEVVWIKYKPGPRVKQEV